MEKTLQSRLPVEFRITNITTVEEDNEFLKKYLHMFNEIFCVDFKDNYSIFRSITQEFDVDNVFCVRL